MADSVPSTQNQLQQQQEAASSSTVTVTETDEQDHVAPRLTLKLRKPKTDRKVKWTTNTVDNEHLNRKKSKCCCIYDKPRKFGESSSEESDDECDHCKGHVEKKKKHRAGSLEHPSIGDTSPDHTEHIQIS